MARSALKPVFYILFGVALGWGIGRVQGWSDGTGAGGGRRPVPAEQGGYSAGQDGGPAGSKSHARAGEARAKPGRERLERLAAGLRNQSARFGRVAQLNLTTEIMELSVEEVAGVTGLLAGEKMGWETTELLLARWAMLDPKAAMAFALGREELSGNVMIMDSIMGELAKTDLPAAKAALAQLGERQQNFSERTIVRQLLEKKDIRTALDCARGLGNDDAETEVLLKWSESDPLAAVAELMPGRESHQRAAATIAEMLISKDRSLFEAWSKRLQDPGLQAAARHMALTADADTDPEGTALAAAEWLASGPEALARSGNLPAHIVQRWLWNEGRHAEVAAWAAGLPEGAARNSAINEAGRLWIEQDTMQASAWLGSLPQSPGRDSAVAYLVEKITGETPGDALEWALTVKTPALRKSALKQLTENWIRKDPEASRQALEALSAEDRTSLLEPEGEPK